MHITPEDSNSALSPSRTSFLAILFRLIWIMLGPIFLIFLAIAIVQSGTFSIRDLAYWIVVVGMIVIRFIDITRFKGETADGATATLSDWRRYTLLLLLVFGAVWGLAHILDLPV